MDWTPGDNSGSQTLTRQDHLYYTHINELREAIDALALFNVKSAAYGALGDGSTDDYAAIQAAIDDADDAGGGTVILPPGVYRTSASLVTPNSGNVVNLIGAGIDLTIIKASAAIDPVVKHQSNGLVMDLTVDGNAEALNGLAGVNPVGGVGIDRQDYVRVKARNISPVGGWIFVVWDQTDTFAVTELHCTDMIVEGPSNAGADGFTITYVDTAYFTNFTLRDMTRSPNFYIAHRVIVDGMYVSNIPSFAGFVVDSLVVSVHLTNVFVDSNSAPPILCGTRANIIGGEYQSGLTIGQGGATSNTSIEITGAKVSNINIGGVVPTKIKLDNCELIATSAAGAGIWDTTPAAGTLTYIEANNCYFDVTLAAGTRWLGSANGTTWDKTKFNNNTVVGGSSIFNITKGAKFQAQNNIGINPETLHAQGNVSGATTFNRQNGSVITATLTGNITTTITDGISKGDTLTLNLTQDGTGGRTITKPSNVKLVGGAFSPSAGAGARDSWTLSWDGTNWVEVSRALNMS